MQKLLLSIVFISLISFSSFGQYNLDYGFSVGASNYLGEIGGGEGVGRGFVSDMELGFTKWAIGGFVRYKLSQKFAIKGSLNYIRLAGDDVKSDNPGRTARNLNFKNDMFEFLGTGEFYIYQANDVGGTGRYNTDFNLYIFGGAGVFYSSPKGQTTSGEWVSLRPLETEGVSYSSINLAIPLGIGFYYTLQRKYRLGLEIGWRTTFTDYIDDISTDYINDPDGISNKTNQGILDEINSTIEEGDGTVSLRNFTVGSKRGNPENNDSYMTATVNFSWAIRGKSKFYKSRNSWVLGKKKRRRRKSRAKF
jgi:hypothetical protein